MTPREVDELDDATYNAFVRYMNAEARELQKMAARRR